MSSSIEKDYLVKKIDVNNILKPNELASMLNMIGFVTDLSLALVSVVKMRRKVGKSSVNFLFIK